MESTLREYNSPRKQNFGVGIILTDCYFYIPLPIVTKHEHGLPFPPTNLFIKFVTNPSTILLVIMVIDTQTHKHTHTHTHKPTPVKTYSHAFAGRTITIIGIKFRFISPEHAYVWINESRLRSSAEPDGSSKGMIHPVVLRVGQVGCVKSASAVENRLKALKRK